MKILALVLFAYLFGSIPFSVIFTWVFTGGKVNLRKSGSGNAGTANTWISVGWIPGLLTGILDFSKGLPAMLLSSWWLGWTMTDNSLGMMLLTIPAVIGHCFPIWMGFRGGMGAGIMYGTRFYITGPVLWLAGQLFLIPNIFIKDGYKKVAFNNAMSFTVQFLVSTIILLSCNYFDYGYFQWGLFHLIGQPVGSYSAIAMVNVILSIMYLLRRLVYCNLLADIKSGIPVWTAVWPRLFFEAYPDGTTYDFPDSEFKHTASTFWRTKKNSVQK